MIQDNNFELTDLLYHELKVCANRILSKQSNHLTLQATEMVHDACIKLMKSDSQYTNKAHLYRCAAKAMRQLLIDHVRAKSAQKRGQKVLKTVPIEELLYEVDENEGLIVINRTLSEMSESSERLETIAELHYFAGLTQTNIAETLSISIATVERELKFARAYLTKQLLSHS